MFDEISELVLTVANLLLLLSLIPGMLSDKRRKQAGIHVNTLLQSNARLGPLPCIDITNRTSKWRERGR